MFDTKSIGLDMFKTWVLCIKGILKRKIYKRMHNNYIKSKDTYLEYITVFFKDDNLVFFIPHSIYIQGNFCLVL